MDEQRVIPVPTTEAEPPKALVVPATMKSLIEALIFAAEEPLSIKQLKAIYEYSAPSGSGGEERKLEADSIRAIIHDLNAEYAKASRPYRIIAIAGGYQFATLKDYADWLGKLRREQGRRKLSQSGVETLAIIAYKQPITKGEVESIRGVNCDYVLKSLLEKELVAVTGRAESVGRPLLYGTTRDFLKHFALNEITDLPRPREIQEILGESQFETERRMLDAQAGAEKAKEDEDFKSRLPHIPKRKSGLEGSPVEIVPRHGRRALKTLKPEDLPFAQSDASASEAQPTIPEHAKLDADADEVQPGARITQEMAEPTLSESTAVENHEPEVEAGTPEAGDQSQQRNRWQTWKVKIQGIIKRLFG